MKKILHVVPGWEDTCRRKIYRQLADVAREKGYEVVSNNVDWKKTLSPQIFPVDKAPSFSVSRLARFSRGL